MRRSSCPYPPCHPSHFPSLHSTLHRIWLSQAMNRNARTQGKLSKWSKLNHEIWGGRVLVTSVSLLPWPSTGSRFTVCPVILQWKMHAIDMAIFQNCQKLYFVQSNGIWTALHSSEVAILFILFKWFINLQHTENDRKRKMPSDSLLTTADKGKTRKSCKSLTSSFIYFIHFPLCLVKLTMLPSPESLYVALFLKASRPTVNSASGSFSRC